MVLLVAFVFFIQFISFWILNSSTLLLTKLFEFRFLPFVLLALFLFLLSANTKNN
tara:strand:- start:1411 stop:1575 length:165 start_codon:yes stop_codon:yes gene_type:complete